MAITITKAEILVVVNARLGRAETDIDEEIRSALYDISSRGNFLLTESNTSTVDGTENYAFPDNCKQVLWIVIDEGKDGKRTDPFVKISFAEYLQKMNDHDSGNEDEPNLYAIHNKYIYPYPVPDDVYVMSQYYSRYHPNSVATILFDEPFREAVYEMTMVKVCEHFQLWDDAKLHAGLFATELAKLLVNVEKPPSSTRNNDI